MEWDAYSTRLGRVCALHVNLLAEAVLQAASLQFRIEHIDMCTGYPGQLQQFGMPHGALGVDDVSIFLSLACMSTLIHFWSLVWRCASAKMGQLHSLGQVLQMFEKTRIELCISMRAARVGA